MFATVKVLLLHCKVPFKDQMFATAHCKVHSRIRCLLLPHCKVPFKDQMFATAPL